MVPFKMKDVKKKKKKGKMKKRSIPAQFSTGRFFLTTQFVCV